MAKAELQAEHAQYHQDLAAALRLAEEGNYDQAINHAMEAWHHVEDMMKFSRRWEKREFDSVPCIDLVLRLAPVLLHFESLERLANVLKENKGIDRMAGDDLAARLADATGRLRAAYWVLDLVERSPELLQADLDDRLGGVQDKWRSMAEALEKSGALIRTPEKHTYRLRNAFGIDRRLVAKCVACGKHAIGKYEEIIASPPCPTCGRADALVIVSFEGGN